VGGKVTVNFTGTGGGSSGGVASVNGLSGAIFLEGGTDISISPSGQTLTINYTGSIVSNAVTSFNGRTGAVQGVSSANGLTGAVTFRGGKGITFSVSGNGISAAIDFTRGGQSFDTVSNPNLNDLVLLQAPASGVMYTSTVGNLLDASNAGGGLVFTTYSGSTPPGAGSYFIQQTGGTNYQVPYSLVQSGLLAVIDGGTYA
jgi:hypothetical protein